MLRLETSQQKERVVSGIRESGIKKKRTLPGMVLDGNTGRKSGARTTGLDARPKQGCSAHKKYKKTNKREDYRLSKSTRNGESVKYASEMIVGVAVVGGLLCLCARM